MSFPSRYETARNLYQNAQDNLIAAVNTDADAGEIEMLRCTYVKFATDLEEIRRHLAFDEKYARRARKPAYKGYGAAERVCIEAEMARRSDGVIAKAREIRALAKELSDAETSRCLGAFAEGAALSRNN